MTKFSLFLQNSEENKGWRNKGRNFEIPKLYSMKYEMQLFTSRHYTLMKQRLDKAHITDVCNFDVNDTTEDFIEVMEFQC